MQACRRVMCRFWELEVDRRVDAQVTTCSPKMGLNEQSINRQIVAVLYGTTTIENEKGLIFPPLRAYHV